MGRPKKKIDPEQVAQLARRFWSQRQIAAFFKVDEGTIRRRFSAIIEENKHVGTALLLDRMWRRIEERSDKMLELALKKYAGFGDIKPDEPKPDEQNNSIAGALLERLLLEIKPTPETNKEERLGLIAKKLGIQK